MLQVSIPGGRSRENIPFQGSVSPWCPGPSRAVLPLMRGPEQEDGTHPPGRERGLGREDKQWPRPAAGGRPTSAWLAVPAQPRSLSRSCRMDLPGGGRKRTNSRKAREQKRRGTRGRGVWCPPPPVTPVTRPSGGDHRRPHWGSTPKGR